jgi:hypothetical protein
VGTPEGKIPLGRPSHRWERNIKIDLKETGRVLLTGLMWLRIGASEAAVNMVMNLWVS